MLATRSVTSEKPVLRRALVCSSPTGGHFDARVSRAEQPLQGRGDVCGEYLASRLGARTWSLTRKELALFRK